MPISREIFAHFAHILMSGNPPLGCKWKLFFDSKLYGKKS